MSKSYEPRGFKREYIPVIIAVLILGLLIAALVYTIMYKPKDKEKYYEENSLKTEEIVVDIDNTICNEEISKQVAQDAANVKVRYEQINDYYFGKTDELETDLNGDGELGEIDSYGYALKVIIEGVTENVYVKLENDLDYNVQTFHASDIKDGVISFDQTENAYVRTYNLKVYSANQECGEVLFREFTFKLPRLNDLRNLRMCEEFPDMETCTPFVFEEDEYKLHEAFKKEVDKRTNEKEAERIKEGEKKAQETIVDKVVNNKVYLIIGIAVVVVIVVGVVVIVIKRRKK